LITRNPNSHNLSGDSYYNTTQVRFNYSLYDEIGLFGYNITCTDSVTGNQEYSTQVININSQNYNLTALKNFPNPGIKNCTLLVADGHTDNVFDVQVSKPFFTKDKLDIGKDITVEFVPEQSDVSIESMSYEQKADRVSPIFNIDAESIQVEDPKLTWKYTFDGDAYEIQNSKYKGHVVVLNNNNLKEGYWIDGEEENKVSGDLDVNIINNEIYYTKTFKTSDKKVSKDSDIFGTATETGRLVYKTDSIGSLNYETENSSFLVSAGFNITISGYDLADYTDLVLNISINNVTHVRNYTGADQTIELGCEYNEISVSNIEYYSGASILTGLGCLDFNSSYNLSFYKSKLTVNVKSKADGTTTVYGAIVNISNSTFKTGSIDTPAIMYLPGIKLYNVNVSGVNGIINQSTYDMVGLGDYTYTVYLDTNMTIFFKDERTLEAFNMSSPDSIYQYTYCNNGDTISYLINSSNYSYLFPCEFDKIRYVVNYPVDTYYRTFLSDTFNLSSDSTTIWLINLDTSTSIFNTFQLYTLVDKYINPKLYFTKNINGTDYTITSDYFNVETKVGTYLLYGEQYKIIIVADDLESRDLGFYTADSTGDKIINLFTLTLESQPTDSQLNNSWWVEQENTSGTNRIRVAYESYKATNANLKIYDNNISGLLLYSSTLTTDTGVFYYSPPTSYDNATLYTTLNITKEDGQTIFFQKSLGTKVGEFLLDIIGLGYVDREWFTMMLLVLLSVIALIFNFGTASVGGLIFVAFAWLLVWLGWIFIGALCLGLAIIIAVGNMMKNPYR
jgi:hypothetical protein